MASDDSACIGSAPRTKIGENYTDSDGSTYTSMLAHPFESSRANSPAGGAASNVH